MKLRFLAFLLALLLAGACVDDRREKQITVPVDPSQVPSERPRSVEKIKKTEQVDFGGVWVNKKYAARLKSTGSPKKAQDATPITLLVLPKSVDGEATVIYNFHEGIAGKLTKNATGYAIDLRGSGQAPLSVRYENGKLTTDTGVFIKIDGSGNKNDYRVAEQLLFAGKYKLDGKPVEFTANGKVTGLADFSYYSVLIDYYDSGMQVDKVRLGKSGKHNKLYGFDFSKHHLTIYELNCVKKGQNHCQVVKNGKKLYKLERL